MFILHFWGEHCPERRYVDSQGVSRICGASDLKASQHYPVRFGAAVTECFLEHYDEVQACVKKTKHTLLSSSPAKEAKDHVWLKGYIFVAPICLSVYRFIGLSVYRFIGLSVYRFIGLSGGGGLLAIPAGPWICKACQLAAGNSRAAIVAVRYKPGNGFAWPICWLAFVPIRLWEAFLKEFDKKMNF